MVTKSTVNVALVAAILLAIINLSAAGLLPHFHVHIVNQMTNNELLLVHCKCSDHDLGYQYAPVGTEFEWRFRKHFLRRTHWKCYLAADKTRFLYLDAYDNEFLSINSADNEIYWDVREDGVYLRDVGARLERFAKGWQTA
ncbi:Self-incompatibility protein S1 [Linum grandiflorum]